jgi:lipid A 3-O-deacylase
MGRWRWRFVVSVGAVLLALPIAPRGALGQDGEEPRHLVVGAGFYDAVRRTAPAGALRTEYLHAPLVAALRPWAGLEVTTDASAFAWGGMSLDLELPGPLVVTPSFGAGLFRQGGGGKTLGHPLEFRTQLEISYEFPSGVRVGVAASHTSNGSLSRRNPGVEVFSLGVAQPLGRRPSRPVPGGGDGSGPSPGA